MTHLTYPRRGAGDPLVLVHGTGSSRRSRDPLIDVGVPVTVAFGAPDLVLLPWQSRHVEQLPAGTRVIPLPGCGHVPTYDDPEAVVALVTGATALGRPRPGPPSSRPAAVAENGRVE